ncbi:MAG: TolC family protein [Planctomycetota bacterium]
MGCTAADYRDDADRETYGILAAASEQVTGAPREFSVERPVDRLRRRLEVSPAPVTLSLGDALNVAAENSRDFQRQKEILYQTALALTLQRFNFANRFGALVSSDVSGEGDEVASLALRDDLTASRNLETGGRIVASFVTTFLKDLIRNGSFNGASILGLTFTQPLLQGAGRRIAREPLNQAERDVIYAMRTYERFRGTFAVSIVSQYYRVLQQVDNLESERQNLVGAQTNRERTEALVEAGQLAGVDLDRASQQEFDARDRLNNANARLQSVLDGFKLSLGLPTDCQLTLDQSELNTLREGEVADVPLAEAVAIELALARRLDYRNAVDEVQDNARRVRVTENALDSILDFSAAIDVPTDPGAPLDFDWSRVGWSAGFDLDLALQRLPERNTYRRSLIALNFALRNREEFEDAVKADVREALRDVRRTFNSFRIQSDALGLSERRLERANDFLLAGRGNTLALLDAQEDLLLSRLAWTGAIVDYAVAKLELLRDLEGLVLADRGLRYDPSLPLPEGPLTPYGVDIPAAAVDYAGLTANGATP